MSVYNTKIAGLSGQEDLLSSLKGSVTLVVNVASKCGLTPQYTALEALYEQYSAQGFSVLGVPCNQFGAQEPGSASEIETFCTTNYGVTFPMMEKISIKGENPHPVYKWLTSSDENGVLDAKVTWNFQKFMIDENGEIVDFVPPIKSAQSKRVLDWLNEE